MSGRWALIVVLVLVARRLIDVVEVRGASMEPTLHPGDRLLLVRLQGVPRAGQVVVARDPRDPSRELVKRVAVVDERGVELRGDNPSRSTDGRAFGRVPISAVRWRAVVRYWPRQRLGRLPLIAPRAPSRPPSRAGGG
ncbi:MAG: nickel-type superoxide dismutase maturation protease [Candidatus Limnocylindria bacterium]